MAGRRGTPKEQSISKRPVISPPIEGTLREYHALHTDPHSTVRIPITDMASRMSMKLLDPHQGLNEQALQQKNAVKREAQRQAEAIHEKLRRLGQEIPKFDFLELIGKGAYGRVFKCHDQVHNRVVALKVIDVDSTDYKVNVRAKDDTIESTIHEIKVLKQLTDSKAKNVNIFYDAFQIHSQLWIVSDYCPGGSVHTLMRATENKVPEKYILVIARELATGLKAVHDAGIIHRDVKSANVMIHENGSLQLIDFGVAGILQSKMEKRSTIIGTPHWMPPELHKNAPLGGLKYGTEVDVWAFGCTLIECATGLPPNTKIEPGRRLGAITAAAPPRLKDEKFSVGLRELVEFVLKPQGRPPMSDVLNQPYLVNTEEQFPTSSLADLVKIYYQWEFSGGKRQSLFYQGGAPAAEHPGTLLDGEEWNFSTTAGFAQTVDQEDLEPALQPFTTPDTDTSTSSTTKHGTAFVSTSSKSHQDTAYSSQLSSPELTIRAPASRVTSALPRPKFAPASRDLSTSTQRGESSTFNQPRGLPTLAQSRELSTSTQSRELPTFYNPHSSLDPSLYVPDDFERYFSSEGFTASRNFDMDDNAFSMDSDMTNKGKSASNMDSNMSNKDNGAFNMVDNESKSFDEAEHGAEGLRGLSLEENEKALREDEHAKRGEKALGGLFDHQKEPYKYYALEDTTPNLEHREYEKSAGGIPRSGSDLPLRSISNESEVHHEVEYGSRSGAPFDVPRINLSTANTTIRARRANERGLNEPARGIDDKADMLGWKFPSTNMADNEASTSMTEPKRATMDWKFPAMDPVPAPALARPGLKHSTTAPVGGMMQSTFPSNPHQSLAVLDLDALYDSDTVSPAPATMAVPANQQQSRASPASRRSGIPYDPNETFADDPTSPEEEYEAEQPRPKAPVRAAPPSPAWPSSPEDMPETRSRPMSKRQTKIAAQTAAAAAHNAAGKVAVASSSVAGPSSASSGGLMTAATNLASVSANFPLAPAASRRAPSVFDNLQPPSAAAMADNAPPEVIEAELRHWLTMLRDGLGEVGRAFAELDAEGYDFDEEEEEYEEGEEGEEYEGEEYEGDEEVEGEEEGA